MGKRRNNKTVEDLAGLSIERNIRQGRKFFAAGRTAPQIMEFVEKMMKQSDGKETLLLFLRRHWLNLFARMLSVLVIIVVLLLGYFLVITLDILNLADSEMRLLRFLMALFSLFIWVTLFVRLVDYYLDIWIVTDRRIINIEQKALFKREVSELRLLNVQDVTTDIGGVVPTLFDYGDLYVQTAGKRERFCFRRIPYPGKVKDLILILSEINK